jgi:nicotinamide-nucleotide amidase|tara:strand:+ start:1105 stop:1578 length:474 start_codon:yes stop_codon:yes gene_type:complete
MSYLKAKHLSELLISRGLTISVAESCTGGSLSSSLTSISGASSYFNCGYITYSNQSKIDMLGVKPESIEIYGAVSEKVAHEMVMGSSQRSLSNIAVSITGIAGPSGGSALKPVGMVCIGFFFNDDVTTTTQFFKGSRSDIVSQSITYALVELSLKLS